MDDNEYEADGFFLANYCRHRTRTKIAKIYCTVHAHTHHKRAS